jgi:hypothetical protein
MRYVFELAPLHMVWVLKLKLKIRFYVPSPTFKPTKVGQAMNGYDSLQIYLFWSSFPKTQVGHIVPLALSHWRLRSALCNQVFQPVPDERRDEQTWGMLQHRVYRIPLSSNQQHPRWKDFVCNGNVRSPFGVTIPYNGGGHHLAMFYVKAYEW